MGETVKTKWSILDGQILFELTVNREAHRDNVPSLAVISVRGDASAAIHISIGQSKPSLVDAKFRSGHYVQGFLQQTLGRVNGVTETRIIGDFHFGANRQDDQRFEGVMASVPAREA